MPQMSKVSEKLVRCAWASNERNCKYHDEEWGVAVHDDRRWFEFLTLEGAQAGLSWDTILQKRERYRDVFCAFDATKVAHFDAGKVRALLRDSGIVRNRLKIAATIANASAFLQVQKEFGSSTSSFGNSSAARQFKIIGSCKKRSQRRALSQLH